MNLFIYFLICVLWRLYISSYFKKNYQKIKTLGWQNKLWRLFCKFFNHVLSMESSHYGFSVVNLTLTQMSPEPEISPYRASYVNYLVCFQEFVVFTSFWVYRAFLKKIFSTPFGMPYVFLIIVVLKTVSNLCSSWCDSLRSHGEMNSESSFFKYIFWSIQFIMYIRCLCLVALFWQRPVTLDNKRMFVK